MNSFCVGLFAVLAVFAGTAFSKTSQDDFYKMFQDQVPMDQMLQAVWDNCPTVQLQHMQAIQQHINDNDQYATYATNLKKSAQKILNSKLREMGQKPVDIMEYMQAASDMASGKPVENVELANVIKQCLENRQKLTEASDEEKQYHLNKMIEAASANDDDDQNSDFSPEEVTGRHDSAQRRIRYTSESHAEEGQVEE